MRAPLNRSKEWLRSSLFPSHEIGKEISLQVAFLRVVMLIGFSTVLAFGVASLIASNYPRAILDFGSCLAFVVCWYLLGRRKWYYAINHLVLTGLLFSTWYSLVANGASGPGLYFPFAFPLVAYFLNTRIFGTLWVALFLAGETAIAFLHRAGAINLGIESSVALIRLSNMYIVAVICFFYSLRQDKMTGRFYRQAFFDDLTDLPNRNSLIEDMKHDTAALMILSIDDFKEINALYGYEFGDAVLIHTTGLVKRCVESGRIDGYRLSGSEFALRFAGNDLISSDYLENTAQDIMEIFAEDPYQRDAATFRVRTSIGIGFNETGRDLLRLADLALKQAKRSANRFQLFQNTEESVRVFETYLANANLLEHSLANDLVFPYFQPIFSNSDGELSKYESLARIADELGNIHTPMGFLDIAKKLKIYPKLTRIMIRKTIAVMSQNAHEYSVNLSYDDFADSLTRDFILTSISEIPDSAGRLTFEILESESIDNRELVNEFIRDVREYGCKIAIDDFGSGYANFDYLVHLDFDVLKIDGSLIKNIHEDPGAEGLVKNIVEFARTKKVQTIAEYVHSEEVLAKVKEVGIDYSQGFFLGKPGPIPLS